MNQSEIRIALQNRTLPIPYPLSQRPDGENFGYLSLVKNPLAIDKIPELLGENYMKEFIRNMNSPKSAFETVRMLHWFGKNNDRCQRILCFGFTVGQ